VGFWGSRNKSICWLAEKPSTVQGKNRRCWSDLFYLIIVGVKKHTHTLGGTPLHEGSVRRIDLYLTTHHIYNREREDHATGDFRTRNPSKQAAADSRRSCTERNWVHPEKSGARGGAHSDPTVSCIVTARRLRLTSPNINIHSWYENNTAARWALGSGSKRVLVIYQT